MRFLSILDQLDANGLRRLADRTVQMADKCDSEGSTEGAILRLMAVTIRDMADKKEAPGSTPVRGA
jgi:hypothetical protein